MTRLRQIGLIIAWTIATALLVVCARAIDWRRAADALVVARPTWLALAVAANAGILMCWAAFWRTLLPGAPVGASVPYRRMMEIVSTTSSLMNTVPFGGGHASSVMLLIRRGGVGRRAALSVLALDQLGEGLVKIMLFLLVAALVPLPTWMRAGVTTASLVVAIWFVTLLIASRWTVELEPLRRRGGGRAVRAFACVVAMKAMELAAIVAVPHAFGVSVSFAGSVLVLAAVILGTMIPMTPGNLGTYEASAFVAYRYLGVAPEVALGLAVVQHLCFIVPAVGVGYAYISARTLARSAMASR